MNIEECSLLFEKRFRTEIQEKWDNSGVQVMHAGEELKGILCALDCTSRVITEAENSGCNLIVTHHPLIFDPIKSVSSGSTKGKLLIRLIDSRISVLSYHTCLDMLYWQKAAVSFGVQFSGPVFCENGDDNGYGVFFHFGSGISADDLASLVKDKLSADFVRISSDKDTLIFRAVFLSGSGGSFIDRIIEQKSAECIITGDISYHRAMDALSSGLCVIDAGHYFTEKNYLDFLREDIYQCLDGAVPVKCSVSETSPFRYK